MLYKTVEIKTDTTDHEQQLHMNMKLLILYTMTFITQLTV